MTYKGRQGTKKASSSLDGMSTLTLQGQCLLEGKLDVDT